MKKNESPVKRCKESNLKVVGPEGQVVTIGNIKKFAENRNLRPYEIKRLISGDTSSHKGWRMVIEAVRPAVILRSMMD